MWGFEKRVYGAFQKTHHLITKQNTFFMGCPDLVHSSDFQLGFKMHQELHTSNQALLKPPELVFFFFFFLRWANGT